MTVLPQPPRLTTIIGWTLEAFGDLQARTSVVIVTAAATASSHGGGGSLDPLFVLLLGVPVGVSLARARPRHVGAR